MNTLAVARATLPRRAGLLAVTRPGLALAVVQLRLARFKSKISHDGADDTVRGAAKNANLVPRSQMKIGTEEGDAAYNDTEKKMQGVIEHHRRELAALELRGSGRVTPAILDPVRVQLPDGGQSPLKDISTIGVRDGTTLLISLYEEAYTKHAEKAIYAAKIPHVVPQKVDSVTLKVPMPKPTVEARKTLATQAGKMTEDIRVQIRRARDAGEKKALLPKNSKGQQEFQKLMTTYIGQADKNLEKLQKALA
ncbi:ribosome recycling factor [Exidia glandulosa HHB12029]|uniref:Ribosome recycling factor n=1 Tax=Exidia glandulosa HHB12029 TaxID=1314781 RepID=A0A165BJH6_EXIGL|nr:ribosome recycling factor [Exidia glandulosa HHB12029]